jgi:hypothetical protein
MKETTTTDPETVQHQLAEGSLSFVPLNTVPVKIDLLSTLVITEVLDSLLLRLDPGWPATGFLLLLEITVDVLCEHAGRPIFLVIL